MNNNSPVTVNVRELETHKALIRRERAAAEQLASDLRQLADVYPVAGDGTYRSALRKAASLAEYFGQIEGVMDELAQDTTVALRSINAIITKSKNAAEESRRFDFGQ